MLPSDSAALYASNDEGPLHSFSLTSTAVFAPVRMRLSSEFVSPTPEQIEDDTHGKPLSTEERKTVYGTIRFLEDILACPKLC